MVAPSPRPMRVALIGNSPPRLCGIATFTEHFREGLRASYPDVLVDVYAMDDRGARHAYPETVVCAIPQDDLAAYADAAHRINDSGADVVCVQHEYGIFGGEAGIHLLKLLDRVAAPVIVTLHTVLERPSPEQRGVIDALARRASRLVVMAEKGRALLREVHGIADDRIAVVPHGVPDRAFSDGAAEKARFGFAGHRVLLTFGLLSPNKGIETMIRAMPAIVSAHPDTLYVVLGATHPHLVAHEGEAYRERLAALAAELGVAEHIRFVDGFVEQDTLLAYLAAADIYVTPYLNEAQIVSGTLSYAVALGRPTVSTPYWHANELLADGRGSIVPFGDTAGFVVEIDRLLADDRVRAAIAQKAYAAGRTMIWSQFARAYMALFADAIRTRPASLFRGDAASFRPVPPRLDPIERLTDRTGIVQHSIFSVPDRNHGYCVDDNCRALMLMHRMPEPVAVRADALALTYAAFVQHAWNGERGRFRNFMGYDRDWLEAEGSEDSFGRTLWSLGDTASRARRHDLRVWSSRLFDQVAPHARTLRSPRAWAFAMLGADAMLAAYPRHDGASALLGELAVRLIDRRSAAAQDGWDWFETVLAYDNARIPEALLRAGMRLRDRALVDAGIATLAWLDDAQTNDAGRFRAVGTDSFGRAFARPLPYDQQPLEAWASIEAARAALAATGDPVWVASAERAYGWYLGGNDLGLPIARVADGECFDGLMADRANLNQGAESALAYQFACCAMLEMAEEQGRIGVVPIGVATS